jgi:hypothetical protein
MPAAPRASRSFSRRRLDAIDVAKTLGIRAGRASKHRFVGVWPIVVNARVYIRSWGLKAGGWYHTFLDDPLGSIQIGDDEVKVRARPVRSGRVRDEIERGYAAKYSTPGSRFFVRGFRTKRRRDATIELMPR